MVHIFEIPTPVYLFTLSLSGCYDDFRLSHVIVENSMYHIAKATKFTVHAQYHVTSA